MAGGSPLILSFHPPTKTFSSEKYESDILNRDVMGKMGFVWKNVYDSDF